MAGDDTGPDAWTLGLYPAAGVLLGLGVGWWLDRQFGWEFKGLVGGAIVGLITGMYLLIKEGMRISKK